MMKRLFSYARSHIGALLVLALCALLFAVSFWLYALPVEAALYPSALCLGVLVVWAVVKSTRAEKKHRRLLQLQKLPADLTDSLLSYDKPDDRDYRAIITLLVQRQQQWDVERRAQRQDMLDYYTVWVHQIKTPIAAMHLKLQNEDTPDARRLMQELSRIEQYVEMVLCYLRLDADSTDYVFRDCALDNVVRQAVRRFAAQFIDRGLQLHYTPTPLHVVTDEKWLLFVLEQVLSNALKYTPSGSITIDSPTPDTLRICDTGIGIEACDLPRIFEQGYTGYNGRSDKRASGLGLYLCRRICANLGHTIAVDSVPGQGTSVTLTLTQQRQDPE